MDYPCRSLGGSKSLRCLATLCVSLQVVHVRGMLYPQGFRVRDPTGRGTGPGSEYPQYPCRPMRVCGCNFFGRRNVKNSFFGYFLWFLTNITTYTPPEITRKCLSCSPDRPRQCPSSHQGHLTSIPVTKNRKPLKKPKKRHILMFDMYPQGTRGRNPYPWLGVRTRDG